MSPEVIGHFADPEAPNWHTPNCCDRRRERNWSVIRCFRSVVRARLASAAPARVQPSRLTPHIQSIRKP